MDRDDLPMLSFRGTVATGDGHLCLGLRDPVTLDESWHIAAHEPAFFRIVMVFRALEALEWLDTSGGWEIREQLRSAIVATIATGGWYS